MEIRLKIAGDLELGELYRAMYSTDASIYRKMPIGVVFPKDATDLQKIITVAADLGISLIPRTAGTSLAGQCVGEGLVVDVSRYMNTILEWNQEEAWVKVQPGVIRDELNAFLRGKGYFFGPITSTANRAMIGGMVGNNSSGTTSIKYGVTRDKVLELDTILSDGSKAYFGPLDSQAFEEKLSHTSLEGELYRQIFKALMDPVNREAINKEFPKASIHRRNTGYAVDALLQTEIFGGGEIPFNFCKLLSGSEGTLAFTTAIKIKVDPLPPPSEVLLCVHFKTLQEALTATLVVMEHAPYGCELMDKAILDCTKENRTQQKNRFFLQGDPGAILIIEVRGQSFSEAEAEADQIIIDLKNGNLGYAFPKVFPPMTKQVLALRAAGFGVLSNMPGDAKPIEFVEDTAVALEDLPGYIEKFKGLMASFGQEAVYYAHAGAGELHLRPRINLKTSQGRKELRNIAKASAALVKQFQGSLSGEHGDGRVRGEFIPEMMGVTNYKLFKEIKSTWDPNGIFNPGKIVDALPMDEDIKHPLYENIPAEPDTFLNFEKEGGFLRLAEKCTGSGDCRKLAKISGGVMCPSYMATLDEKDSTRGRANALREILIHKNSSNAFADPVLKDAMDLCISCKGCTSECPSNVDMSVMKAEYLYQLQKIEGVPLRSWFFGHIADLQKKGMVWPSLFNWFLQNETSSGLIKRMLGVADGRSLPNLGKTTLLKWLEDRARPILTEIKGKVYLFLDEFTNLSEPELGKKTVLLLEGLGFEVSWLKNDESGRAALSKGLLEKAGKHAIHNVEVFSKVISKEVPLLGIEPSAILSFRDEYLRMAPASLENAAQRLSRNSFTVEEFLYKKYQSGELEVERFHKKYKQVSLHGHCHQKALSEQHSTAQLLSLVSTSPCEIIPSGCCGMAGSFGYEKEHFDLSIKIGELVLFPYIRKKSDHIIAAPGTSCRHQITDGTGKKALHPLELLYDALIS